MRTVRGGGADPVACAGRVPGENAQAPNGDAAGAAAGGDGARGERGRMRARRRDGVRGTAWGSGIEWCWMAGGAACRSAASRRRRSQW